jgi:hypothetical protein
MPIVKQVVTRRGLRRAAARRKVTTAALLMIGATVGLGAGCPTAIAGTAREEFGVFGDCPLADPTLTGCVYAKIAGGEMVIGQRIVPITSPIVLRVGLVENETTGEETVVGAADGDTLTTPWQSVPGGLTGSSSSNTERVAARIELVGPASSIGLSENNLLERRGPALSLPVRLQLMNPLLGSECYIGSSAAPIFLALTDGTTNPLPPNRPMSGKLGFLSSLAEGRIQVDPQIVLVDNAFSIPRATGCGGRLASLFDAMVDAVMGLPAAAGHNTATITASPLEQASPEAVRENLAG